MKIKKTPLTKQEQAEIITACKLMGMLKEYDDILGLRPKTTESILERFDFYKNDRQYLKSVHVRSVSTYINETKSLTVKVYTDELANYDVDNYFILEKDGFGILSTTDPWLLFYNLLKLFNEA